MHCAYLRRKILNRIKRLPGICRGLCRPAAKYFFSPHCGCRTHLSASALVYNPLGRSRRRNFCFTCQCCCNRCIFQGNTPQSMLHHSHHQAIRVRHGTRRRVKPSACVMADLSVAAIGQKPRDRESALSKRVRPCAPSASRRLRSGPKTFQGQAYGGAVRVDVNML